MKKILCFGDSNTFGYKPENGGRYNKNERWTGVLNSALSKNYEIIEAGLNNRNCFAKSPCGKEFCGCEAILKYRDYYDFIIFALGINDLQIAYNISIEKFKIGLKETLQTIKNEMNFKKLILISPAELNENVLRGAFSFQFDENSIQKSKKLAEIYKLEAKNTDAYFIDLNKLVKVSNLDGLHFDLNSHEKIGKYLADFIQNKDLINSL